MGSVRARRGAVWIAEDFDADDPPLLTGRFSGYLERDDRPKEAFDDLGADDAIAWGRARAAVVLIRSGDGGRYYSAGEHNPDPQELPVWPPKGIPLKRRRARGFEALDNTEGSRPVLWDVRIEAAVPPEAEVGRFHEKIRSRSALQNVQTPAPGYSAASAAFLVEAATHKQAREIADRILEEAFASLFKRLPKSDVGYCVTGVEVYPYRPGEPVAGPGVTY